MARQLLLALSLVRCALHSLNLEDRHRLSEFAAIAANHTENLLRDETLAKALLRHLFQLLVKEPLVDLNPLEACDFRSLLALLAIRFATGFEIESLEVVHLVAIFAKAVLPAAGSRALMAVLFAQAFTGHDDGQLGRILHQCVLKTVGGGRGIVITVVISIGEVVGHSS